MLERTWYCMYPSYALMTLLQCALSAGESAAIAIGWCSLRRLFRCGADLSLWLLGYPKR